MMLTFAYLDSKRSPANIGDWGFQSAGQEDLEGRQTASCAIQAVEPNGATVLGYKG